MPSDRILATSGAGYIGSHTCKALAHAGYEPVIYDDLSKDCAGDRSGSPQDQRHRRISDGRRRSLLPDPAPGNQALIKRYEEMAEGRPDVVFTGRLATCRYYNMDRRGSGVSDVPENALGRPRVGGGPDGRCSVAERRLTRG